MGKLKLVEISGEQHQKLKVIAANSKKPLKYVTAKVIAAGLAALKEGRG